MTREFVAAVGAGVLVVLLAALPARHVASQALPGLSVGPVLPASCVQGASYLLTSGTAALYVCTTANTWATITASGGDGVPAGAIVFIASGSCPTGYAEVAALNGRMLRGTVTANGNVGGTGGADSVTPAGTVAAPALTMNSYTPGGAVAAPTFTGNSVASSAVSGGTPAGTNGTAAFTPAGTNGTGTVTPLGTIAWPAGVPTHSGITATFSGSALATHAHELPWQIPSTTTIRQIAVATFGTGTNRAATAVSAAGTANTTSAAVALSQAISAGTPAGTVAITSQGAVAWPAGVPTLAGSSSTTSAQTFTGQAGTVPAQTFTGSALGTHQHTTTATGTNSAPGFTGTPATLTGTNSVPAFSGAALDNRAAYLNLIGCVKQ